MNRIQCKNRQGFSLLELLMVISVTGVLLAVNATWIHQSLSFSATVNQRQRQHQILMRLAGDLRDDVRLSTGMSSPDEKQLELAMPGDVLIRYVISSSAISVEKRHLDNVFFRDSYAVAAGSDVRWDRSELPDWISLIVYRKLVEADEIERKPSSVVSPEYRDQPVELLIHVGSKRWPATLEPLVEAATTKESP